MTRLSQLEEFDVAIKNAARDAEPGVESLAVAEDFYESHRDLVQPLENQWVIDKLAALIGKFRAKARRESNRQLFFEEHLGFAHIPRKVELPGGKTIPTGEATSKIFGRLKTQIRKEKIRALEPALEELKRGKALFTKYTKNPKNNRITWAEIIEKEGERQIQLGMFDPPGADTLDYAPLQGKRQ